MFSNNPETFWKRGGRFIWEMTKVIFVSLAIVIPIRYFLIQPFFVKGASMEPNFEDGEYLIVNELSLNLKDPQRGEVIIFRYPKDPGQYYIKRIIGLPGERVKIEGGQVYIFNTQNSQGFALDESEYLYSLQATPGDMDLVLSGEQYFVLGDNRQASSDSRIFGPITREAIIGKAWVRAWPFDRLTKFEVPSFLENFQR